MPLDETPIGVTDTVTAELVDCPVPVPDETPVGVRVSLESTPVADAAEATIEHTGADPPPAGPREVHPVQERPDLPLPRQIQLLTIAVAQLWDQVWWLSLPPDRRAAYEAEGFTAPIQVFYPIERD